MAETGHAMLRLSFRSILIAFMFWPLSLNAQDIRQIDSLVTLLNNNLPDSVRIRYQFDIAEELGTTDTALSRKYLEAGRLLADPLGDPELMGRYYLINGKMDSRTGQYDRALAEYDRALAYFHEAEDHLRYYETVKLKGNVYLFTAQYDQALNMYETALDFYRRNEINIGISRCLNNMGIIHKNRGNYLDALMVYEQSINFLDPEEDALDISQAYINMGNIFVFLGTYDQAIEHYERALEISRVLNNQKNISLCLINTGVVQNKCGNYDEALNLYQQSLQVSRQLNDPVQISNCLINIGTNYADMGAYEKGLEYVERGLEMKIGLGDSRTISNGYIHMAEILVMMKEFDRAIDLFNRAIPVKEELGDQEGLVRCYLGLGSIYRQRNQFGPAEQMADKGLALADTIKALEHLAEGYELKREIALAEGDYRNAYQLAVIHQRFRDSLVDQATTLATKEMEYRNQSMALQQENDNLRIQSELNKEILRKRNAFFYSILGLAFLLAAGLALVAYFLRQIRSSSQKLEEKNLVITRQNLKLDQLNRNKDRMMSIIAHDLRGTIGNQLTAVEVLHQMECDGDQGIDRKKLLGNLKHSAGYSLELLENLLHWSRLGEDESNFYAEETNLKSLIETCISLFDESAATKEIRLKTDLNGTLTCMVDKIMFETILRNLISNAIKFSNPGGTVSVSAHAEDGHIHLKVEDQGIGMDRDQLKKVTTNGGFTRRGTANEKGAGIGLTLVREFTAMHQGTLHIESDPGGGSVFEVVIPC